jgi:hypothetical protein
MAETNTKIYKYSIDDWVTYIPFPDVKTLSDIKHKALVLEVLVDDYIYDYYIVVDGTGEYKNVKASKLFPYVEEKQV